MKNILYFFTLLLIICSCSKNSDSNSIDDGGNKLIYIKQSAMNNDSIVAIFNWKEKGLIFNCYGKNDISGNISKIKSVSVYKDINRDTVYNFTFDESMRVKSYYRSINNIKDPYLLKCNYQDSLEVFSVYENNPNTNLLTLKERNVININTLSLTNTTTYSRPSGLNGTGADIISLALSGICIHSATGLIFGIALVPATPILTAITSGSLGVLFAIQGAQTLANIPSIKNFIITIGKILSSAILPADAGAAELDNIPSTYLSTQNPFQYQEILDNSNSNNLEWNWCPCVANLEFPIYSRQGYISFNNWSIVTNVVDTHGALGSVTTCSGGSSDIGDGLKTRSFLLKPHSTVILTHTLTPACSGTPYYTKDYNFECN